MKIGKRKIFIIFTFVVFLFSCKGASLSTFTHLALQDSPSEDSSCCISTFSEAILHITDGAILTHRDTQAANVQKFISLFFTLIFTIFIGTLGNYLHIRQRHRNVVIWNYFTLLFKRGILHPKTF